MTDDIPRNIIDRLRESASVAVMTGAGMSAESGVPTFRGEEGLWHRYRAEELATPQAFAHDPRLVWEWYDFRRQKIAAAEPHAGHVALARLEEMLPHFTLITQNIDGLHRRAGSRRILELHGNIMRARCVDEQKVVESVPNPLTEIPPRCECGALLRPDVVWFGEGLPEDVLAEAFREASEADVMLVVGTSAVVYPAAAIPAAAAQAGALLVEVNPDSTPLSSQARYAVTAKAGEFLPRLVEALSEAGA